MQHLGTRLLRTQRLVLRRMTLDDCHDMYKNWACDPAVTRYLRWNAHRDWTVTAEFCILLSCNTRTLHFINGESACRMAPWSVRSVCSRVNAAPLMPGAVCLRLPVPAALGNGVCVGATLVGQGYAPEALAKVLRFWFEEVGARFWLPATPF